MCWGWKSIANLGAFRRMELTDKVTSSIPELLEFIFRADNDERPPLRKCSLTSKFQLAELLRMTESPSAMSSFKKSDSHATFAPAPKLDTK